MPIPFATTTVTVWGRRPSDSSDPDGAGYGDAPRPAREATATGVRCNRSSQANGNSQRRGKEGDNTENWRLDLCDVTQFDQVQDERTGEVFNVALVKRFDNAAGGLEHVHLVVTEATGLNQNGADAYS